MCDLTGSLIFGGQIVHINEGKSKLALFYTANNILLTPLLLIFIFLLLHNFIIFRSQFFYSLLHNFTILTFSRLLLISIVFPSSSSSSSSSSFLLFSAHQTHEIPHPSPTTFLSKLNDKFFCLFPAAMLVPIRMGTNMASPCKAL